VQQDTEITSNFITSTVSLKQFIIHGFLLHALFILLTLILHVATFPFFQQLTDSLVTSTHIAGLVGFGFQMLTVVAVLFGMTFIYASVKRFKTIPVFFFTVYPPILLLFSATRVVSSSLVFLLAWLAVVVVMTLHYQRFKQQEFDNI